MCAEFLNVCYFNSNQRKKNIEKYTYYSDSNSKSLNVIFICCLFYAKNVGLSNFRTIDTHPSVLLAHLNALSTQWYILHKCDSSLKKYILANKITSHLLKYGTIYAKFIDCTRYLLNGV